MFRLLAVADVHLGRQPTHLPETLQEQARRFGAGAAWQRVVEQARERQVQALLLAGDVVDHDDDFFEAYRELARGVGSLLEAGITVVAVAGNHDTKVLPRLARELPGLHLLGAAGEWEKLALELGGERVVVWGRCFVAGGGRENPLARSRPRPEAGFNLALLHCDLDQSHSNYAPVSTTELQSCGLDAWLLGHVHRPHPLQAQRLLGYLGAPTALARDDLGARGPWLLEITANRCTLARQLPLAPLRHEELELDLTGLESAEDAEHLLLQRCRELAGRLDNENAAAEAVGLRLRLGGRSRWGVKALHRLDDEQLRQQVPVDSGRHFFLEEVTLACRPEHDLEQLAQRRDPPGLLAQRILLMESENDARYRQLLARARHQAETRLQERGLTFQEGAPRFSDRQLRDHLRQAALLLLDGLLEQGEDDDAPAPA